MLTFLRQRQTYPPQIPRTTKNEPSLVGLLVGFLNRTQHCDERFDRCLFFFLGPTPIKTWTAVSFRAIGARQLDTKLDSSSAILVSSRRAPMARSDAEVYVFSGLKADTMHATLD